MQKEILTKEKCVTDLRGTVQHPKIRWWHLPVYLLAFAGICILNTLWELLYYHNTIQFGVCGIIFLFCEIVGIVVFLLAEFLPSRMPSTPLAEQSIQSGDFRIVEDKLVRARQKVYCPKVDGWRDLLEFENYGDFFLHSHNYYQWTSLYQTNARGVFDSSRAWDTFYLVIYHDKVVMVYNTKMFELSEDLKEYFVQEERPKREVLTKERIQTDLLITAQTIPALLLFVLSALWSALMAAVCFGDTQSYIGAALFGISAIVLMVAFIKFVISRRRIKKGRFRVVQDTLVGMTEDVRTSRINYRLRKRLDQLVFADCGKCFLAYPRYYQWSGRCSMRPKDVFDNSGVGDTFYLVIYDGDKNGEPVMVYNTKFFQLEEVEND